MSTYVIKSPINGTVEQFEDIYEGISIQSGKFLANIIPESKLIVECYVSPDDIGYLSPGMDVNFQISSFNYNEWGVIHGTVKNVSNYSIHDNNNNTYFKVKCSMSRKFLTCKKTMCRGYVKNGMNVTAHFIVANRSLFDLLYQNFNDWLNPTQYKK